MTRIILILIASLIAGSLTAEAAADASSGEKLWMELFLKGNTLLRQVCLTKLGYYSGPLDGTPSREYAEASHAFTLARLGGKQRRQYLEELLGIDDYAIFVEATKERESQKVGVDLNVQHLGSWAIFP